MPSGKLAWTGRPKRLERRFVVKPIWICQNVQATPFKQSLKSSRNLRSVRTSFVAPLIHNLSTQLHCDSSVVPNPLHQRTSDKPPDVVFSPKEGKPNGKLAAVADTGWNCASTMALAVCHWVEVTSRSPDPQVPMFNPQGAAMCQAEVRPFAFESENLPSPREQARSLGLTRLSVLCRKFKSLDLRRSSHRSIAGVGSR